MMSGLPAGTRTVGWYTRLDGSVPGSTTFQIQLSNARGDTTFLSDLFTAKCRDEAWAGSFCYPSGLPAGLYQFSLILDGRAGTSAGSLRVG